MSKTFQIRALSLSLQLVEEDVDQIEVVGEEEEETRVRIFLHFFKIFSTCFISIEVL